MSPKRTCSRWKPFLLFLSLRGLFQQAWLASTPELSASDHASQLTLLSKGFIKTSVPCCSHGGLHVLTKYPASTFKVFADTEISSFPLAPPSKDLRPQHKSPSCWGLFITQGWDRGLKLNVYYHKGRNLTTVHHVYPSDYALSQLQVHSKQQWTPSHVLLVE